MNQKATLNWSRLFAVDAEIDRVAAYVLEKNAPLMEALARSEREDAATAPEELALKHPNRR